MSNVTDRVLTVGSAWTAASSDAWETARCPHCGASPLFRVGAIRRGSTGTQADLSEPRWLRCPACAQGSLALGDRIHPSPRPFREPKGLPQTDAKVWSEARICFGAGANAAAVMLCRKLLFHIAVENGLEPQDGKGRAPSFKECVEHLQTVGIVSKPMLGWVDRIRDVGNDGAHEVSPVSNEDALAVGVFTEQLLTLAYELPSMMAQQGAAVDFQRPQDPRINA